MTREGYCCGCNGRIWFWQRTGFNSSWHKRCTEVWEAGYQTAKKFAEEENAFAGYPTPWEIYAQRSFGNHKVSG